MQIARLQYMLGTILFVLLYALNMQTGGYRLPQYYAPDGEVSPFGVNVSPSETARITEISGREVMFFEALLDSPQPLIVTTLKGTGIMQPVPNNLWDVLGDFKFLIILSFVFLFCGFWFLDSGNDVHLASFCIIVAVLFCTTVLSLAYHRLQIFRQLVFFASLAAFFNLGLRTTGKEIPGQLVMGELMTLVFLTLIAFVGRDNLMTFVNLKSFSWYVFYGTALTVMLMHLQNMLQKTTDRAENFKRIALFSGIMLGLILPFLLFRFRGSWLAAGDPMPYLFWLVLLFPVSLLYGTHRMQLVPFQFVLTRSIAGGMVSLFFIIVYGIVLLTHNLLIPPHDDKSHWMVHLVFVLVLVFLLDPARRFAARWLQRDSFRPDVELNDSLEKIARLIASPLNIQTAIVSFLNHIQEALGVEKVNLLLSHSAFPDLHLKTDHLNRLADKSPIWKYLKPEKITAASYLTYGSGNIGELYRYLVQNRFHLAIGITGPARFQFQIEGIAGLENFLIERKKESRPRKLKAALLIGGKLKGRAFSLAEISYLKEASRLAGMLMYNYILLLQEVEKRRKKRELLLAGQVQRSISNSAEFDVQGVKLSYFSLPVISVTGDYLDLITLSSHSIAFFLGDVSGHGLGTGYLVSTFRSMIRSHLLGGASLVETVETLNDFLLDRYRGSEFITLFAFILNTQSGEMEYLNAAHPGPYIRSASNGEIKRLKESQRLLGVLPSSYSSSSLVLQPGDRLFAYSDGVTETFNDEERAFGDANLFKFIRGQADTSLEEITDSLQTTLNLFRGSDSLSDDTTFVALEFSPEFGLRTILSFFGLEDRLQFPGFGRSG